MDTYEQKYKEAVEKIRNLLDEGEKKGYTIVTYKKDFESIFPELKESEDERIKKELIAYHRSMAAAMNGNRPCVHEAWIAWLEKQGANSTTITKGNNSITNAEVVSHYTAIDSDGGKCTTASTTFKPKFKVGDFIVNDYCMGRVVELTNDAYLLDTEQGIPFSCEHNVHLWSIKDAKDGDILASNKSIFIFQEEYIAEKPTAYCGLMNGLFIEGQGACWTNEKCYPATKEQCDFLFQKMHEAGYEWDAEKKELKEIGQNPIDKFEPKFHEGDIVIKNTGFIGQILEVGDNEYILTNTGFIPFKYEHLWSRWTIEDAKDGDVLQLGEVTAIFEEFIGNGNCCCYCSVCNGEFEIPSQDGVDDSYGCHNAKPATKEQCDFLFQKMHEAGYEWNAEKKELKKINKKHPLLSDFFKSEYERGKADAIKEMKSVWSKDDERILTNLIDYFNIDDCLLYQVEQIIDWLKSLKERVQPKQDWSEEDEKEWKSIVSVLTRMHFLDELDWLRSKLNE